jgi:hypothetical protein
MMDTIVQQKADKAVLKINWEYFHASKFLVTQYARS